MSVLTTQQYMINNGISNEDSDGDTVLRCLKYTSKRVDDALTQIGLLPPDVTSFGSALTVLTTDMTKLKNNNVVNVKEYGAVGNNIADDTAAIVAAIAVLSANNSVLYFPYGTYKISGELRIASKNNLLVRSDGARVIHTAGVTAFYFLNCSNVRFQGSLNISTTTTGITSQGLVVDNCPLSQFTNITVSGDFLFGVHLFGFHGDPFNTLSCTVSACRTGIQCGQSSQYWNITNCNVWACSLYGIFFGGGNHIISNSGFNENRIGIYVAGGWDHSQINSCSVNHNYICNIFIRDIYLSLSISACQIWACIGGGTTQLTECTAVAARTGCYGIYMQNSYNVSITNCVIAHSLQQIGLDGYNHCIFSNNIIKNTTNTTACFIEYGQTNATASNINFNNIITNNIVNQPLSGANKDFVFFDTLTCHSYTFENNRGMGETMLITANGTYEVGLEETILVNSELGVVNMPDNTAAARDAQALSLTILPCKIGSTFTINFFNMYNSSGKKYIWIKFKQPANSTVMWTNGSGWMQHIPSLNAICINTLINQTVTFRAYNAIPHGWIAQGINSV
jgi:hypothetical protein